MIRSLCIICGVLAVFAFTAVGVEATQIERKSKIVDGGLVTASEIADIESAVEPMVEHEEHDDGMDFYRDLLIGGTNVMEADEIFSAVYPDENNY